MSGTWLLDHSLAAVGKAYARHVVPAMFGAWQDEILTRLDPRPGERALDVACGTGELAVRIAQRVGASGQVTALDASPGMLAIARRQATAVTWHDGDAHTLPFPDGHFHMVSCPHGLMFFHDPARALAEMTRVLHPDGRLVASVWATRERNPHEAALAEAFTSVTGHEPPFFRALFSLANERALMRMARRAGLDAEVRTLRTSAAFSSPSHYWRGMAQGRPVASLLRMLPAPERRRIRRAALRAMRPHRDGRGYRFVTEGLLLHAVRRSSADRHDNIEAPNAHVVVRNAPHSAAGSSPAVPSFS